MKKKIVYFSDELNDDFSPIRKTPIKIDGNFKYVNNNFFWKLCAFVVYRIIIYPFAYLFSKIKFHIKIVNKKVIKPYKHQNYFLYGNHTQVPGDAFFPNMISYPKRNYFIVNAENVSTKGTKNFMMMLGALPLPDTLPATRNFLKAIDIRCKQNSVITIYPEAHIWPYYTDIRPFTSASFKFPIRYNAPTFAFTTTYVKRKYSKKPKIILYVDGPFFKNETLDEKEQVEDLRNQVYNAMKQRAKSSTYEYIKYVRK